MKTLIVDDLPESRKELKGMLEEHHPEIEVAGMADCVNKGIDLIRQMHPDLVFLDIEMPDGSGFDLLKKIINRNFIVIFITAHNKYAIAAIKFGALDFLTKPIDEDELAKAIKRAQEQYTAKKKEKISIDQLRILLETLQNSKLNKPTPPSRIAIRTLKLIQYKPVKKIIRLEAQHNYTTIVIEGEDRNILASQHLKPFVVQFAPYFEFMQVHRSNLVNLRYVESFVIGESYLIMKDGSKVSVSRRYKDELIDRLSKL